MANKAERMILEFIIAERLYELGVILVGVVRQTWVDQHGKEEVQSLAGFAAVDSRALVEEANCRSGA